MKHRHRVVWAQGMFLTPQHFQTLEHFLEDDLQFRFTASQYANWGVTRLEIDSEALANKVFRLNSCSGIMPDGEPVEIPDTDEAPASRTLGEHFPPNRQFADVYLAIPEKRPGGRQVTVPSGSEANTADGPPRSRYVAETLMFTDENLGEEEKPVQIGRRTFRLLFGDEYRDGMTFFRIARVIRDAAGVPILDPKFAAPCLNLASSAYLLMLLRRQIEILATKSASLSAPRRERGKLVADFPASETANFWLLHTVNSYLPELKHIWKTRQGHPEAAFVAMLRLAGALTTFSLEGRPENLPDYDHDDLGVCFTALDVRIRNLIDLIIPTNFIAIPLDLKDRLTWIGSVSEDQYFRNSQFFLAVSAKMGVDDLIRKIPQLAKAASAEEVRRIVNNALPGLTLRHTPTPPAAIPMRLENQYFAINQTGDLWESVVRSRQFAVFAPGEIVDPKMELVIVLEQ